MGECIMVVVVYLFVCGLIYMVVVDGLVLLNGVVIVFVDYLMQNVIVLVGKFSFDFVFWCNGVLGLWCEFCFLLVWWLCLVVEGCFNVVLLIWVVWEWDIVVGSLIVECVGCVVIEFFGRLLCFNCVKFLLDGMVVVVFGLYGQLIVVLCLLLLIGFFG